MFGSWRRNEATTQAGQMLQLEELLNLWAHQWVQEHNNATLSWMEYTRPGLEKRVDRNHSFLRENRYLSFKDMTLNDVTTLIEPEVHKFSILGGESSGWSVAMNNDTQTEHTSKFSTTKTLTTQKQVTWTSGVTLNLGTELRGGVPLLAEGGVILSTALSRLRASTTVDTNANAHNFEQIVKGAPGKKTFVAVGITEIQTTMNVTYQVNLQGYVMICCNKSIACPEIPERVGNHKKWYVTIDQVFTDLRRYAQTKTNIARLLAGFKHEAGNVSFELTCRKVETMQTNAEIKIREEDILGWAKVAVDSFFVHQAAEQDSRPGVDVKAIAKNGAIAEAQGHEIIGAIFRDVEPSAGFVIPEPKHPEGVQQTRDVIANAVDPGSKANASGNRYVGAIFEPASDQKKDLGMGAPSQGKYLLIAP